MLESGAGQGDAGRFFSTHKILRNATPIVILPGSRVTETSRLMPVFRETMARLQLQIPNLVPVLAAAPGIAEAASAMVADWPVEPIIVRSEAARYDAFAAAKAALTKSGTSTLELAMAGVPMAVTYRVNPLSGAIGRRVIKVPYVAMINLLANRELVPELLQQDCKPEKLAATLQTLLSDPQVAAAQRAGFASALGQFAGAGNATFECRSRGDFEVFITGRHCERSEAIHLFLTPHGKVDCHGRVTRMHAFA